MRLGPVVAHDLICVPRNVTATVPISARAGVEASGASRIVSFHHLPSMSVRRSRRHSLLESGVGQSLVPDRHRTDMPVRNS